MFGILGGFSLERRLWETLKQDASSSRGLQESWGGVFIRGCGDGSGFEVKGGRWR